MKTRWKNKGVRVKKGKYGSKLQRDISEQCSEEQNRFSNCNERFRAQKTFQVDTRTSDNIMLDAFDECNNKSYQIRTTALEIVCTQLQETHNPDFFETDRHQIYIALKRYKEIFAGKMFNSKNTKKYCEWQMAAWTWTFLMTLIPRCSDKKPFFWPQVLQYIEKELDTPVRELTIGRRVLNLDNWSLRVSYEMLSNAVALSSSKFLLLQNVGKENCASSLFTNLKIVLFWHRVPDYPSPNITKHLARNEKLLTKLIMAQSTERSPFSLRLRDVPSEPSDGNVSSKTAHFTFTRKVCDIEKLSENLVLATNKLSVERVKALEDICKEFHLSPHDFVAGQIDSINVIIFKAMKRGNEIEQLAAVRSTSISTNAQICTALAFIQLINSEYNEPDNRTFTEPMMSLLRQIFSVIQPKRNWTLNGCNTHELSNILRMRSLEAWGLLLTICSLEDVSTIVRSNIIDELTELMLNDSTAEMRIVCGQVISLIVEQGRLRLSKYFMRNLSDTCTVIRDIINDRRSTRSNKRKLLKTNLRATLKYLEDGCNPTFNVRFDFEIHELKTWSSIFKYQKLSRFIGPNVAAYFLENERMRAIVPIGSRTVLPFWYYQPSEQHKLRCAATKKSKTKENRLNVREPKFGYL